jgi:hypothetical protein
MGIACGRVDFKKCSTPGCTNHANKLCDYPVERNDPPKRGDARLHREHKLIFYVWTVDEHEVTISQKPPGGFGTGVLQTVPIADWFAKSQATCDRPTCQKCSVSVGPDRDYCAAHGRLYKQQSESK